jgi:quercetin dioxygenase-like cupin family protein
VIVVTSATTWEDLSMVRGVIIREREAPWVQVMDGIYRKALRDDQDTGAQFLMFKLEPGRVYPEHGHPTGEEFYVVEGSITVDDAVFNQGDYYHTPRDERHFNRTDTGAIVLVITPPFK